MAPPAVQNWRMGGSIGDYPITVFSSCSEGFLESPRGLRRDVLLVFFELDPQRNYNESMGLADTFSWFLVGG
jgi:hypothetical protein